MCYDRSYLQIFMNLDRSLGGINQGRLWQSLISKYIADIINEKIFKVKYAFN